MKRIFIAALLALVFIPSLVFGADFTKKILGVYGGTEPGLCSAYYHGFTWLFYRGPGYVLCKKVAEDLKTESEHIEWLSSGYDPGAACVFKDSLYFFMVNTSDRTIGYIHLKGSTWDSTKTITIDGQHVKMGKTVTSDMGAMAAAVLNDTLYLFFIYEEHEGDVRYAYTSDGVNWIDGHGIIGPIVGNVAACNYQTPDGEQRLMIAWMYKDWDYQVSAAYFDGNNIRQAWALKTDKGKTVYATAVSSIFGSAPSYVHTSGHLEVQLFYVEKAKYNSLKRAIFDVNTGTWHANDKPLDRHAKELCAVPMFTTEGANIRKEAWCVYSKPNYPVKGETEFDILCYDSDLIVVDPHAMISHEMDTIYRGLWSLIGVLEGPPPYHLNGKEFDPVDPPTTFIFGTEEEKGNEITHEYEMSFLAHAGVDIKGFGASAEYRHGMASKYTWDSTFTKSVEYTVSPDPVSNWGYHVFLKPTITRGKFEVHDYQGNPYGIYDYFFFVTGGNIQIEPYEMDSVNTHFIETFENRYPDPQDTICSGEVTWLHTLQSKVSFGTQTENKTTNTTSNTLKVEAGFKKIFDIGGAWEGSITFEGTHSSSINKNLGFELNGPACGAPRPGFPEDVVSYNLRGYWIQSRHSNYYWIPDDYKDCRPWLFTWNVTNIVYQEGSAEDVEEEELAACLNLDIAGLSSQVTISYTLPRTAPVSLKIYDPSGRLVKALVSGEEAAGEHSISWDGSDDRGRALAGGVYFARLNAGEETRLAKIVLTR